MLFLFKNMKKITIRIVSIVLTLILGINALCFYFPVYASEPSHGGGGGTHEGGATNSEGDYTAMDFWEDVSFGGMEITKFVTFFVTTTMGFVNGTGYKDIAEGFITYMDNVGTGEWIHVDANNNVTYDQELIDLLKQFLTEYAQQHPEEVEKINYRIIHTSSYKELFDDFMDYGNYLKGNFTVPNGFNRMERFEQLWLSQTEYEQFPHLLCAPFNKTICDPDSVQDIILGQELNMFESYENNLFDPTKTSCFIGEFGNGSTWGDESHYHIKVCTYDKSTGSITVDRMQSSGQNCHFVWDSEQKIWVGTEAAHGVLWSSWDAYINVSATWWGNRWGVFDGINPELVSRYTATYNADKSVNIPVLATPNGSSFRLFTTEQDAMRYFEACADSGLNFDPNQVYTGGSVTINNNGDVTINNNPSDNEDNPPINNSEIFEMIYNRLGEILTQVAQIKQFSVADTVINAFDTYKGDIDGIADELVDSISQVFPFCILWDFVRIVKIFEAEPISPVFEIPIKFVWIDETITIDLTEYETIFALLRTGEIILFLLGLFNITMAWVGKGDEVI